MLDALLPSYASLSHSKSYLESLQKATSGWALPYRVPTLQGTRKEFLHLRHAVGYVTTKHRGRGYINGAYFCNNEGELFELMTHNWGY